MAQSIELKAKGVYSHQNFLSEVPPGALRRAAECVIDREGLIEPRRGRRVYGSVASPNTSIRSLIPYENALIEHHGTILKRDSGGGFFIPYDGTFQEPPAGRIRGAEANGNLYIPTAAGMLKLDGITSTWKPPGTPRPLDGTATLTGSSGFLADQTSVGYRAVLFYTDAKNNEIVSAPSQRLVVSNTVGGAATRNVSLTWFLPTGLTTGHSYRLYRSAATPDLDSAPSDELQLVKESKITSSDLTAGMITAVDSTPDGLRGAALYTNPSQEGIQNANDLPPFATDLCLFESQQVLFAFNVKSRHRYLLSLLGVGTPAFGSVVATGASITSGSAVVTGLSSTTGVRPGMRPKNVANIPGNARVLTVDSASQVTLTVNATGTASSQVVQFEDVIRVAARNYFAWDGDAGNGGAATSDANGVDFVYVSGGSASENIEGTALALVRAINGDALNTQVYAFYTSGFEDLPGGLLFEERGIGGDLFFVSGTAGSAFSPALTALDSTEKSDNNEEPGGIRFSKPGQPEAWPLGNLIRTGRRPIRRGLALRDGVFAFADKIYRLSGNSLTDLDTFDTTTRIRGADTARVFNDQIFTYSDQGLVSISDGEGGVKVVSRPIERDLLRVSSDNFPQFEDIASAWTSESDRKYYLAVPDSVSDTVPTKVWVYNAFTSAWTEEFKDWTCGVSNPADDKLYLGNFSSGAIYQERKSFDRLDFADEEFSATIVSAAGTVLTLSSTVNCLPGRLIKQEFRESVILEVIDATQVRVADEILWLSAASSIFAPIVSIWEWLPNDGANAGIQKQFPEVTMLFQSADFRIVNIGFATNAIPSFTDVACPSVDTLGGWGEAPWGELPWGVPQRGEQPIRQYTPRPYQRAHWISIRARVDEVFSSFACSGLSIQLEGMTSRYANSARR